MSERPRVLAVIANDTFLRNFIDGGAFPAVTERHDLGIVASDRLRDLAPELEHDEHFRGWFHVDPDVERRHYFLFSVLMWRHRAAAGGFRFRARRTLGFEYLHLLRVRGGGPNGRWWAARRFGREVLLRPGVWAMLVLGSRPLAGPYVRWATRRLPVSESLRAAIERERPDVLLFPSSAYDPIGNDASRVGRELGIPTAFLIDNWDNLSSKSLFWTKPDHVGVWGPQSREHAERLQGFPPDRVHEIGTPRFDGYLHVRDHPSTPPVDGPYALFVGCALPFDEVHALRLLDDEIERHPDVYGDLRIVYRPHPWGQRRFTDHHFDESTFRHVVLDPQIRAMRERGESLPALDHYAPLLKHAAVVIAPLTTMLIEALLFNRPVIAIAYDDGVHYTSPSRALRAYEHFHGVEDVTQVTLCEREEDLAPQLRHLVSSPSTVPDATTERELAHFIRFDETPYGERLVTLIERVLATEGAGGRR